MRRLLVITLALGFAVPAAAIDHEGLTLRAVAEHSLDGAQKAMPQVYRPAISARYSNVTTFLGAGVANGGAALQAGNTITRLVADDLTPTGGGVDVFDFTFSVVNFDAVALTFRPRVRFWFADGAGGGPGTYYNLPASVGFTFNPVTVNATTIVLFTASLGTGQMTMPTSTFWAGMTFDDNNGTTGATAAQLNNLGQGLFGPATVGSSADLYFETTAAGSFFGVNNPAGSLLNLNGNPPASFGWEFNVDTTVAVDEVEWSAVKALYR